jgi:hypothetical protein
VLFGNGDGTFQDRMDYKAGSKPNSVAVGDFDEDDTLDIVVSDSTGNNVGVLIGNGDGTFPKYSQVG